MRDKIVFVVPKTRIEDRDQTYRRFTHAVVDTVEEYLKPPKDSRLEINLPSWNTGPQHLTIEEMVMVEKNAAIVIYIDTGPSIEKAPLLGIAHCMKVPIVVLVPSINMPSREKHVLAELATHVIVFDHEDWTHRGLPQIREILSAR